MTKRKNRKVKPYFCIRCDCVHYPYTDPFIRHRMEDRSFWKDD
jgi:hypothetical protein